MNVIARATCVALVLVVLSFSAIAAEQTPTIVTKGDVTTITLPLHWSVVSLQRHAVPLGLPVETSTPGTYGGSFIYRPYGESIPGAAVSKLANELNRASARLSQTYTITFKVKGLMSPGTYEVWTRVLPGTVRFVY